LTLFGGGGNGLYQVLSAIGLGMAIWMIAGVIGYSARRGKRDFASSSQFVATSFDVVVDFEHAQAARTLAAKLPMRPHAGAAQSAPTQAQHHAPATTVAPAAAPVQAQPQDAAQSSESDDPRRGQFPDLPDGRPRYGVRVSEPKPSAAPASAPQEQGPVAPQSEQEKPATENSSADSDPEQDLSSVEPRVNPSHGAAQPSKDNEPEA